MDWIIKIIIGLMLLVVVGGLGCLLAWNIKHNPSNCYKGHYQKVHHEAWTQTMIIGDGVYTIFHPASDSEKWVCIQHERVSGD